MHHSGLRGYMRFCGGKLLGGLGLDRAATASLVAPLGHSGRIVAKERSVRELGLRSIGNGQRRAIVTYGNDAISLVEIRTSFRNKNE